MPLGMHSLETMLQWKVVEKELPHSVEFQLGV
jgi:hypothetical protein